MRTPRAATAALLLPLLPLLPVLPQLLDAIAPCTSCRAAIARCWTLAGGAAARALALAPLALALAAAARARTRRRAGAAAAARGAVSSGALQETCSPEAKLNVEPKAWPEEAGIETVFQAAFEAEPEAEASPCALQCRAAKLRDDQQDRDSAKAFCRAVWYQLSAEPKAMLGAEINTELEGTHGAESNEVVGADPELEAAVKGFVRGVTELGLAPAAASWWVRARTSEGTVSEAQRAECGDLESALVDCERQLEVLEQCSASQQPPSDATTDCDELVRCLEALLGEALEGGCRRAPGAMDVFQGALAALDRAAALLRRPGGPEQPRPAAAQVAAA